MATPSLEALIAELPPDTGVKQAIALLHGRVPEQQLTSRAVRELLRKRNEDCAVRPTVADDAFLPMATLRAMPGKGIGVVATRAIKRGEHLLTEEPLLVWALDAGETVSSHEQMDVELVARLAKRSEADRTAFWNLHQNESYGTEKVAHGLWLSNAWPVEGLEDIGSGAERKGAVFERTCRFNHRCGSGANSGDG